MPTKKPKNPEQLLTHPIIVRVNEETFRRLEKIHLNSNCQSIGEVARNILSREKILMLTRDLTMNAPMEELASIRKELRSIGININQQTKHFHTSENEAQRSFYFMRTSDLYKNVGGKVDRLLELVTQMSMRWLQGY
ncbi:mobilization protein [Pedobacter frigidisoli]|uniref:Mobilization protein n=1 Tax=Pedobacter frigidisoli TaxID=2530455 RepID=A0A4R0NJ67_9SPHI|nr:mobilization protein [Pedobacter frigidisoli]TCD00740.1 mobilization protein [Pedobacter frigidisoli]